ncbi:TIM barrel protein [Methanocaldococcus indicus]|uniref:TIM barrel protein n=1 Tax=Methanocaldococcus indicus TaxID=213231 RepID=UPI003C6CC6E3
MNFGSAGTSKKNEFERIKYLKSLDLNALELEFIHGVYMSEDYAKMLKKYANDEIIFSAHAPHYINLNANDLEKLERSKKRIIKSAKVLRHLGKNLVFHCGYYLNKSKRETYNNIKENLKEVINTLSILNIDINLRPENTGKINIFGDLDEILNLCYDLNLFPCVDFHHIYARSLGKINNYDEFYKILEKIENILGKESIKNMHIHLSGVEYGKKGEIRHLPLELSNFNYKDVLKALKDFNVEGTIICESPLLERDAQLLKKVYETI